MSVTILKMFRAHLLMGVSGCDCTVTGMCPFLEYFHGWV